LCGVQYFSLIAHREIRLAMSTSQVHPAACMSLWKENNIDAHSNSILAAPEMQLASSSAQCFPTPYSVLRTSLCQKSATRRFEVPSIYVHSPWWTSSVLEAMGGCEDEAGKYILWPGAWQSGAVSATSVLGTSVYILINAVDHESLVDLSLTLWLKPGR